MRSAKRLLVALVMALLLAVPVRAAAVGVPDAGRRGSLTVSCQASPTVSEGEFRIWRVASFDDEGALALEEAFAGSGVSLAVGDAAGAWRAAADTLAAWAADHAVAWDLSGSALSAGHVGFGGLTPGLYLICGEGLSDGTRAYDCGSTLVSVPTLVGGDWAYDVTCELKVSPAGTEGADEPQAPGASDEPAGSVARDESGDLAGTGDNTSMVSVVACVAVRCALVLLAVLAWRRRG